MPDVVERDVQLFHQINDPVRPEGWNLHAGLGVQRDQIEPGRHDEDPFLAPVGPVAYTAARILPWGR